MSDYRSKYKFEWLKQWGFDVRNIQGKFIPADKGLFGCPWLAASFELNGKPLKITFRSPLGVASEDAWEDEETPMSDVVERICKEKVYLYVEKLWKEDKEGRADTLAR